MDAPQTEPLDQGDQVVRVERQRISLPVGPHRVGRVIPPAVGDHVEPGRERGDLRPPAVERLEAPMHQYHGDPGAALQHM